MCNWASPPDPFFRRQHTQKSGGKEEPVNGANLGGINQTFCLPLFYKSGDSLDDLVCRASAESGYRL